MTDANNVISRRHDLDNLRSFLTGLVVVHHTALTYGGFTRGWYYESPLSPSAISPPVLVMVAVNQSYFMGLFFWISGRLSAQSLERSGPSHFAKNKLIRLGIPAVIYTLLVHPITICIVYAGWDLGRIGNVFANYFKPLRAIHGPVWYTALLLVFDLVATGIAQLRYRREGHEADESDAKPALASSYRTLSRWGWLGVAAASFFVRLFYPVGKETSYIITLQPAYVSQYIFAYIIGYLAYFEDESRLVGPFDPAVRPAGVQLGSASEPGQPFQDGESQLVSVNPGRKSRPILYLAIALTGSIGTLALLALIIRESRTLDTDIDKDRGGWNVAAAMLALWNEYSFVTLGPAIMTRFEAWRDRPTTSWVWKARYSYAAFLLHPPVIVALDMLVDMILVMLGADKWAVSVWLWKAFGPITLTIVIGILGAAASFVVGRWVVDYVPWVKRAV
jgi:peptidoglycan/LPS O-acetylase OafA/YrhL